jgi:prepilin-type N-terminal cleavage/methylation domain-containing protein
LGVNRIQPIDDGTVTGAAIAASAAGGDALLSRVQTPTVRMSRNRGLTIVECLIAMTILAVIVLVTCHTLAAGQEHVQYGDRRSAAVRLGRDMLEEIASRPYRDLATPTNFGPEAGETARAALNDVDDYHGFNEAAGALSDFAGNAYPTADQGFSRSVTITANTLTVPNLSRTFTGLSVIVTVRARNGEQWQFTRFIPEPPL